MQREFGDFPDVVPVHFKTPEPVAQGIKLDLVMEPGLSGMEREMLAELLEPPATFPFNSLDRG
jgi:hypothetical protein